MEITCAGAPLTASVTVGDASEHAPEGRHFKTEPPRCPNPSNFLPATAEGRLISVVHLDERRGTVMGTESVKGGSRGKRMEPNSVLN